MMRPNPIRIALGMLNALRVARPASDGDLTLDHSSFGPVLDALAARGGLANVARNDLETYLSHISGVDPADLRHDEALAFWINVYNALAIRLALDATDQEAESVLDLRAAFHSKEVTIAGEALSLIEIEHGKIRRFGDPRIHAALVCGSLSCPTLRPEPFDGSKVSAQLENQMQTFLASGGAVIDRDAGSVSLSRVFLWYGPDFVRPTRMPSFVPVSKGRLLGALAPWLSGTDQTWVQAANPEVEFQSYDWGLGCAVA